MLAAKTQVGNYFKKNRFKLLVGNLAPAPGRDGRAAVCPEPAAEVQHQQISVRPRTRPASRRATDLLG